MEEPGDRSSIPVWDRCFYFLRRIQTNLGAHPTSSLMGMGTGALPTRVKHPRHEADHVTLVSRLRVHRTVHTLPHTS
jgi:hypothetical protein